MNVSAVANGQYATYQSYICNKTGDFNEFLQEQFQKPQEPARQAAPNLTQIVLYDLGSGQPVFVKRPDISTEDMELHAYAKQLAVELGLEKQKAFGPNNEILYEPRTNDFLSALQELLDEGSISREDIINAVKYPPKIRPEQDGDRDYGVCLEGQPLGRRRWNIRPGFERYAIDINYKDFETTKPITFSSASDLFKIIWGKEKSM
ncbi:MAG: DUF4258 domain-containing protein [Fibromonadaceae bacterium]|nr:DUF4258 domain-containing protein [Fibromonadaceae bacterium]